MGWLYRRDPIDDPVAYLADRYNHDGEQSTHQVLAASRVGNTGSGEQWSSQPT